MIDSAYDSHCSEKEKKYLHFAGHWFSEGRNPAQTAGQQQIENFIGFDLALNQKPLAWLGHEPSPREYLHGNYRARHFYKNKPTSQLTRPASKSPHKRSNK